VESEGQALALMPREASQEPRRAAGRAVGQIRGVLAERVIVSTELDPFLTLKALAEYSDCSVRWLRDRLEDPDHPLPHYRVGAPGSGRPLILVRRSDFDAWMHTYYTIRQPDDARVDALLAGLREKTA
jgi:hypothetical protein